MSMFQTENEYRKYLEGLAYEELLGEQVLNDDVKREIEGRLDAIRRDLESLPYDELLPHERLEELAEDEIEKQIAAFEPGLKAMGDGVGGPT
jgi:hypothetical protein